MTTQTLISQVVPYDWRRAAKDVRYARSIVNASCFLVYNKEFKDVLGPSPTTTLIHSRSDKFAHEAGVYLKSTKSEYFTANFQTHDPVALFEIDHDTHTIKELKFPDVVNANGACAYREKVLYCSQGDRTTPSALVLADPQAGTSEVLLNNYHGREFNSINDVVIHHETGDIWFTDPTYGWEQNFRPYPQLPSQIYRFRPSTGQIWCVADGFVQCNGLCFSPDYKRMYVTDTGAVQAHGMPGNGRNFSRNPRLPSTIYAYDVVDNTLVNRRTLAYCDDGVPDGINCDTRGNVYSGCGDGVHVWDSKGMLIGKILVGGCVANFNFVKGGMWMLAEERLFFCKLAAEGIHGIISARTYLELNEHASLLMIEADDAIGGIWGKHRVYPHFSSQTGARATGFADLPLEIPASERKYHDLFESKHVASYLEAYVDNRVYAGKSLRDRTLLRTKVDRIQKQDGNWVLQINSDGSHKAIITQKLIIASGHFCEPLIPAFAGGETFTGTIVHQKNVGISGILEDSTISRVAVLGGSKSAADMVYASTKAGKEVSWIIRATGEGPLVLLPPEGKFPYSKNSPEDGSVRLASGLSPSIYLKPTFWSWLLHATILGEWILNFFFRTAEKAAWAMYRFDRPTALPGYQQLQGDASLRWGTGSLALLQYPDFFDTVAEKVHVYRNDVKDLNGNKIRLMNGEEIETDVLLLGTGWTNKLAMFPKEEKARLGLPEQLDDVDESVELQWSKLEAQADKEVLERFPNLRLAPPVSRKPVTTTPYRLYRGLASLNDDSIIFPGQWVFANTFLSSQVQALWGVAFLLGHLQLPPRGEMEKQIALHNAWSRRRYPSVMGSQGAFLLFEMTSYFSALLEDDLDLHSHRHGGGWWSDLTTPILTSDFTMLLEEFRAKLGSDTTV
ncbi:hypothetical protein C1H76_8972 [Elsinoe australis]|uniref:SMP-30/Gluconolactonase/LRE-like region domain-containing protein n=1 Tax=Elsinoe australis TaxID=40998 RepID=A0A4U7AQL1_9PEZI|nr:hypothetical protein C1H76_8972 [Elsinoe australis]